MPDIVLFGATGYTGRLTAAALGGAGADFTLLGRDARRLNEVAGDTGAADTKVVTDASDVDALVRAIEGAKVLITCVGPFLQHGRPVVEAALRAGVHYVDSTGEGPFIDGLIAEHDGAARAAGVVLAPAFGFDEAPGDVAVAMATEGLERPEVTVTYAVPSTASRGTLRSIPAIVASRGPFIRAGSTEWVGAGERDRWSPMPEPLGPKRAVSFPLALLRLAPLHVDLEGFETYVTTGNAGWAALRLGRPALGALTWSPVRAAVNALADHLPEGPSDRQRQARWTILAEARSQETRRNVTVTGTDAYGLTGETLAAAAMHLAADGCDHAGVLSPTQVTGVDRLKTTLEGCGVTFHTYGTA